MAIYSDAHLHACYASDFHLAPFASSGFAGLRITTPLYLESVPLDFRIHTRVPVITEPLPDRPAIARWPADPRVTKNRQSSAAPGL